MFGLASLAPLACGSSGRPQYGAEDEPTFAEDAGDEAQDPSFGEVMPCPQDPGNYDIPGNGCDDDADGVIDNGAGCDDGLPFYGSADDFAKTLGLCKRATGANDPGWGVISASYTRGHTSTAAPADGQHGILPTFGDVIKAREGKNLGILSTGWARPYNDLVENQCDALGNGEGTSGKGCFKQGLVMQAGTPVLNATPPGYPKPANGCAVSDQIFDPITVKLTVKVPKNVQGFSVDFDFWSGEWPDYVCTRYNDGFLIYLQSSAFNGGKPENIAFDAKGNALSVNNGFFDRCTANTQTGCRGEPPFGTSTCGGDVSELKGTGFLAENRYCNEQTSTGGGATGWLTTSAPVTPGEIITLEFAIWDTGDPKFDSSVLLDHFVWTPTPTEPSTTRVR